METSAKTILLVEDEALIALSETLRLEQAGYKVIHALTGESAIAIVNENASAIDLILMDINLGPGIDGTGAAQEVLKSHDIPIVFLSSHTEPEIVKKTEEITNYGYVVKSSTFTVLDASIKMAFKLSKAKKQLDLNSMEIETANDELRKSLVQLQKIYDDFVLRKTMNETLFRLSPDAICISRMSDGVILDVNQSFSRLFGYTREEALGHSSLTGDLGTWVNPDARENLAKRMREQGGRITFEMDFRGKDGRFIKTSTNAEIIAINGEDFIISSLRDISTNRCREIEHQEIEDRYHVLFEEAGAGILIYDKELRILDANKESVQMFGYSKEELLATTLDRLDPDLADPVILNERAEGIVESGPYRFPAKRWLKDGTVQPVEVNAIPILWQGGQAFLAVIHDIAEKAETERKYRESQAIIRTAMESPNEVLMVGIDQEFKCLYINRSYQDLKAATFGLEVHVGDCLLDMLPKDRFLEKSLALYQRALAGESIRIVEDYDDLGLTFESVFSPIRGNGGELLGASAFSIDITERMALERQLRESEERFRLAMEASKDAMWDIDLGKNQVYFSPGYFALFGYTQELTASLGVWPAYFHSDEFIELSPLISDCIENRRQDFDVDYRATLGDGSSRWLNVCGKVVERDSAGQALRLLGTIHDISERKDAEAILREKEFQLKAIGDNVPAFLAILDAGSLRFEYVNRMYELSYGLTKDQILGRTIRDIATSADYENAAGYLAEAARGTRTTYERQFSLAQGEIWGRVDYVPQFDEEGRVERIMILGVDITGLKKSAEEKAGLTTELKTILDTAPVGIAKIQGRRFVWMNSAAPKLFNYPAEELMNKEMSLLFGSGEAFQTVADRMHDALAAEEGSFRMVEELVGGDGRTSTIYLTGKAIDSSDLSKGFILAGEDITKEKRLEDRLVASEAKYRVLFKTVSDALCIIDRESGTILDCNEANTDLLGFSREELIGTNFVGAAAGPEILTLTELADSHLIPLRSFRKKDGTEVPVEITTSTLKIDGREVIVAAMRDISLRMESEREIKQLLHEKELILREVHHRIKNNLQVMVSILSIRVADSGDEKTNMILNEAIGEIESMSLMYDRLYRTEYVGTVPAKTYFPELLSQAAQVFGGRIPLNIETEIEDIALAAGILSRLGIVINELVTNSLKYAFAGVAAPTISLRVSRHGERVHLEYEDNGVGLPESFSPEKSDGFGMQLIQAMLHQIGGTVDCEPRKGARFLIGFEG